MRYLQFSKEDWGRLRALTPLTLTERDLAELRGINERISLEEVTLVYLPLSRLLNLYVAATQRLRQTTDTFLGRLPSPVSYVIAIAGSVADLMRTNLSRANLRNADFWMADMKDTNLQGAELQGANLSDATNLTKTQIDSAITDDATVLPSGLRR